MKKLLSYFSNFSVFPKHIKRSHFFYFLTIVLIFFTYAGNATKYYVSSAGNDKNSGTSESSTWRSLAKVNSFIPRPGDQILFKRGDEWSGTITVNASGAAGSLIVYGAYGTGVKPKIFGSEEITGWKLHSGNIYKATFNSKVDQLFINNKRSKLARYPNTGYFEITAVNSSTRFTSTDLDGGINYSGASWIGRTTAFTMFSKTITASSSQTLTIDSTPFDGSLMVKRGFFLCDKLEFLDQAGEWYYDTSSNTVYLWTPTDGSPANYVVRGSISDYGVDISDKNYIVVKDFEILHSSEDGIYINNSDYITVDNNHIISPDLVGVHIPSGNSNSAILTNNYIYQANGGGIRCYSPSVTITDNTIEDTGLLENINKSTFTASDNFGTGIFSRSNNPTINYNRVINSGYCGINWKGQNGKINYNYINGACQVLDDGGGIYTYNGYDYNQTASSGSEVKNNIVLNVYGNHAGYEKDYDLGFGIYMDYAVHHVTIENNLIAGATGAVFINPCGFITINNNTIIDANLLLLIHDEFDNSTITNNIFYTTNRRGEFKWWGANASQKIVYQESGASAIYNNNTYISHYETDDVFVNIETFAKWKSITGQDANSTFDSSRLAEGEIEELFYNDTKQTKSINLGSAVYKDITGKQVSGTLTLSPFTSKILIKKKARDVDSNQTPVIQGQIFEIQGNKQKGEWVGQIVASAPDPGQILNYSIIQGNEEGLFSINLSTGEIFTNTNIQVMGDTSIDLVVMVIDNVVNPLSSTAIITINMTGGGTLVPDSTAPIIPIPSTSTQSIDLKKGWNIFSSYLVPLNPDMYAVQKLLRENGQLIKVQDKGGNTYEEWGTKEGWINNIGELQEQEGYRIKVKSDCVLEITGQPVYLPLNIEVRNGWNLISFPYNGVIDAMIVIQPLIDAGILEKIQDEKGNSIEHWSTSIGWINGIGNFKAGEGYKVLVNANGVLAINEIYPKSSLYSVPELETSYFNTEFQGNGSNHMNINVIGLHNDNLQVGDEIAVYDGGICVGAIKLTETHIRNNAVSVNASVSDEILTNGFIEGNSIELRTWNAETNKEFLQHPNIIQGNMLYQKQASVFVELNNQEAISLGFDSIKIDMYPNPASNNVTIKFSELPEIGTKIILIDITGKQLLNREVQSTYEILNIRSYPEGMYFVKTVTGNSYKVNKLIIN